MKLKIFFDQYGWDGVTRLFKAIIRKAGVISETFFLLKYTLNETDIINKFNQLNYDDVKELTKNDLSKIEFLGKEKLKIYENRFKDGNYSCYAVVNANQVSYLTWVSWKYMNYPAFFDKKEALKSNEALLEDSFCRAEYRGKGYHSKMNIFRLKQILERNKSEVLVLVLKENTPALKVQLKSGFDYYFKIKFIKVGNWIRTYEIKLNGRN